MYKIGVDIVEISRIKDSARKHKKRFLDRIFTQKEVEYSQSKAALFSHLAARFCAKEAVMKALSCAMDFKDIEILNNDAGAPQVILRGRAKEAAKDKKIKNIQISLSHCKTYAIATAIVEIVNSECE